jgi:hypothetical protein
MLTPISATPYKCTNENLPGAFLQDGYLFSGASTRLKNWFSTTQAVFFTGKLSAVPTSCLICEPQNQIKHG